MVTVKRIVIFVHRGAESLFLSQIVVEKREKSL